MLSGRQECELCRGHFFTGFRNKSFRGELVTTKFSPAFGFMWIEAAGV